MNQKLSESEWKSVVAKNKIKDNGLQQALAAYAKVDEEEHDARTKAIAQIAKLADTLKKSKEIAAIPAVAKYVAEVLAASLSEQKEVAKSKAAAELTQKHAEAAVKAAAAKAKDGDKEDEEDEEEEELEGAYHEKLMAAIKKLRGSKDISYQFLICDAKPHVGLMLAKRINSKHKEELTRITGGSKRFLKIGNAHADNAKLVFEMEDPVTGIARKLQESIKYFTGKKMPIMVGSESAEDEEEQKEGAVAAAKPPKPELAKAPEVWKGTRDILEKNINALKKAIQAEYANESPDLIAEINGNMDKLDAVFGKLDTRLSDSLARAGAAKDAASRSAELKASKGILAEYIKYVKSEPLIDHIDKNPFGVKTNLRATITGSLTHMAQAIG